MSELDSTVRVTLTAAERQAITGLLLVERSDAGRHAVTAAADLPKTRTALADREREAREAAEAVSCFWPAGFTKADIQRVSAAAFGGAR